MSWLARSLVNSFEGEDDDDESESERESERESEKKSPTNEVKHEGEEDPTRGVKEDLSELTKTLTRQFWGVASFLAPPPADEAQSSEPTIDDELEALNSPKLAGIRSDLAEIGGRLKSGISMLSSTKAVSEISKIASNFLPFGSDQDEKENCGGGGVGVSEEIVEFAKNVSMHPETWLDFPAIPYEFDMSDAQQEHALAVERLAPNLASLRIELCPSHMSEGRFWKIYFVLLYSRLNRQDSDLFTTPQIEQARALLLQDLPNHRKAASEGSDIVATAPSNDPSSTSTLSCDDDDDPSTSIPITRVESQENIDDCNTISIQELGEDIDDWLEEDNGGEMVEEDVSFSDLEEDDDDDQGTSETRIV